MTASPLLIRGAIAVNADAETRTDVLCIGGRIAALGARAVREAPAGVTMLDGTGQYLLPATKATVPKAAPTSTYLRPLAEQP